MKEFDQEMIDLAKNTTEFENIISIPGIGELTAALLIGELGNIREFKTNKQLNAFVGIDIKRYQSGTSKSRDTINKRGNKPQQKALIATDIAVNIPKGYVGLLTSRSGVSSKTHLVIETGKIDAGFQGHMQINIKNDNEELASYDAYSFIPLALDIAGKTIQVDSDYKEEVMIGTYQINKGDKLAQLVIVPIITPELEQVGEFSSESARGEKGFGSSGF
ncbi:transposase [Staphylococcus pseudintermedius]|uniref:transposase n=1 Tax=Staphylococcus pseudintermedius TaxID=283734 RepID=UPI00286DBA54|nr:transposase [Staphylococcus pseudintermedius]WMZ43018.1 transposase [Staphylococcus pseudintermedius]